MNIIVTLMYPCQVSYHAQHTICRPGTRATWKGGGAHQTSKPERLYRLVRTNDCSSGSGQESGQSSLTWSCLCSKAVHRLHVDPVGVCTRNCLHQEHTVRNQYVAWGQVHSMWIFLLHDKLQKALQSSCLQTSSVATSLHIQFPCRALSLDLGRHAACLDALFELTWSLQNMLQMVDHKNILQPSIDHNPQTSKNVAKWRNDDDDTEFMMSS